MHRSGTLWLWDVVVTPGLDLWMGGVVQPFSLALPCQEQWEAYVDQVNDDAPPGGKGATQARSPSPQWRPHGPAQCRLP